MRFHFGVSFSWKNLKKIIIPILIGVAVYFGLNMTIVHAETFTLPITGGGGGLTYQGGVSGGQTKWCTKTINSTEYVYRCGGLYNDTFSAGVNLPGGVDNLLSYSTQWYTNSSSLCGTSQTSVEFYVYAYPYNSFGGPGYDFWSYYNIASIAYPPSSNGTCSYSRISKNMLKVNCTYDSDEFFQFNIYGSLNGKTPPSQTAFQMLIKRNVTYVCNATNNDLNNTLNNGFNNMTNVLDEKLEQLKDTLENTLGKLEDTITDSNVDDSFGSDFFDGFDMNDHGVNTIVTAPLRLINGLLDGTSCEQLSLKINLFDKFSDDASVIEKEVALPSGCILWNNVPTAVVTLYQTVIFGLVAYRYLLATKKTISNIQNPTNSEIEVIDL